MIDTEKKVESPDGHLVGALAIPAASTLEALLSPVLLETFLREAWAKTFHHIPGFHSKFADLFSWERLNEVLETHRLDPLRLRLMAGGTALPAERYTRLVRGPRGWESVRSPRLDSEEMVAHLKEGATIALRGIDELSIPVRDLCESMELFFHGRLQTNLYASWSDSAGFETHYDDHDVFVLQIAGRKQWKIYGPPKAYPLEPRPPGERAPGMLHWQRTLDPGDLLYLPRGWWHSVIPLREPTLHLTVGVFQPTGMDLLAQLSHRAQSLNLFRMDLPLFSTPQEQSDHLSRLREAFGTIWPDDLSNKFYDHAAKPIARPRFHLPEL